MRIVVASPVERERNAKGEHAQQPSIIYVESLLVNTPVAGL